MPAAMYCAACSTAEAGGVAVDRLAAIVGRLHLGEATGIAVEDAGEVHHLAEVANPRVIEQRLDFGHGDLGAGRFERRSPARTTEHRS